MVITRFSSAWLGRFAGLFVIMLLAPCVLSLVLQPRSPSPPPATSSSANSTVAMAAAQSQNATDAHISFDFDLDTKLATEYGLTAVEQSLLQQYGEFHVRTVMGVSLLVSLLVTGISTWRFVRQRSYFNAGVVLGCLFLLVNDVVYVVVMATWISPLVYEWSRLLTPSLAGAQIAGLSFARFRVRTVMLCINYTILFVCMIVFVNSLLVPNIREKGVPKNTARKVTLIAQVFFTVIADFILSVLTFRIVLKLRATLDDTRPPHHADPGKNASATAGPTASRIRRRKYMPEVTPQYRATIFSVLISLVGMFIISFVGIGVYVASRGPFLQMLAGLFARLYVLFAMAEWYLIVDLVTEGRRGTSTNGGGDGAVSEIGGGGSAVRSRAFGVHSTASYHMSFAEERELRGSEPSRASESVSRSSEDQGSGSFSPPQYRKQGPSPSRTNSIASHNAGSQRSTSNAIAGREQAVIPTPFPDPPPLRAGGSTRSGMQPPSPVVSSHESVKPHRSRGSIAVPREQEHSMHF